MIQIERSSHNPIVSPNKKNFWEADATFNGSVVKKDRKYHMLFRALSPVQNHAGVDMPVSTIGHTTSTDGVRFSKKHDLFIKPEHEWEKFGCEDPRITPIDDMFVIFYTALSAYPFGPSSIKLGVALTKDFKTILEKHPVTTFNSKAMALFPEKINGKYAAVLTPHTDTPPSKIAIATFEKLSDLWSEKFWNDWHGNLEKHTLPLQRAVFDQIEVGAQPIKTKKGWLLLYAYIKDLPFPHRVFGIEAVLLDLKNPKKIIAKTSDPIMVPEAEYELNGMIPNIIFPSGAILRGKTIYLYYGAADTTCCVAKMDLDDVLAELLPSQKKCGRKTKAKKPCSWEIKRYRGNPILEPVADNSWESKAVFNPAAIYEEGKVHIVYRAVADDDTSVFGYASSKDGLHIDERFSMPVYVPRAEFEKKLQPGNSGCEDPRITRIGKRFYMCYTAFDGKNPPRVALTSISVKDFLEKSWTWKPPVLISPPGIDDKDACVFPEKIKGKYTILHRFDKRIWIDRVDSLSFNGKKWIGGKPIVAPRPNRWDNKKIGIAGPPLKTKAGWLLLYHGITDPGNVYKTGAMLLRLDDPSKVIAITPQPILEPEKLYEKVGLVPNVVFPCGNVIIKNTLYIYFGGADKVVEVATVNLSAFLKWMTS